MQKTISAAAANTRTRVWRRMALSKDFNVQHVKTTFPHKFLNNKFNKNIDLNYIGYVPDHSFFGSSEKENKNKI
jgi:hypothetical protein